MGKGTWWHMNQKAFLTGNMSRELHLVQSSFTACCRALAFLPWVPQQCLIGTPFDNHCVRIYYDRKWVQVGKVLCGHWSHKSREIYVLTFIQGRQKTILVEAIQRAGGGKMLKMYIFQYLKYYQPLMPSLHSCHSTAAMASAFKCHVLFCYRNVLNDWMRNFHGRYVASHESSSASPCEIKSPARGFLFILPRKSPLRAFCKY